jgi:hypothetical protein
VDNERQHNQLGGVLLSPIGHGRATLGSSLAHVRVLLYEPGAPVQFLLGSGRAQTPRGCSSLRVPRLTYNPGAGFPQC